MVRLVIAACLLPAALAAGNTTDGRRLSTDWLTPGLELGSQRAKVCRVELFVTRLDEERGTGVMTLYRGEPTYNLFGDAQKDNLQKQELQISLSSNVKDDMVPPPMSGSTIEEHDEGKLRYLYQLTSDDVRIDQLQLVWSKTEDYGSRLLVKKNDQLQFARVLPLRAAGLSAQAKRYPKSDPANLRLASNPFLGMEERLNYVELLGRKPRILFSQDQNYYFVNRFGDIVGTTLVAFPYRRVVLQELHIPDPTGEKRRLFRCEIDSVEAQLPPASVEERRRRNRQALRELERTLVLHPREGGWHRLIERRSGLVYRVLPLHSKQLQEWLRIRRQLAGATDIEQEVFQKVSSEIPYFSGFRLKDHRVVEARLLLTDANETVVRHLVDLPHLRQMTLNGRCTTGTHIGRLANLEKLRFAHGIVSDDVLLGVGDLRRLKSLSFYTTEVDCSGLKHLARLEELTHFAYWLGERGQYAKNFDDSCVAVFSQLPNLKVLALHALPLTAAGVEILPTTDKLVEVMFGDTAPFVAVLRYAQRIPHTTIQIGAAKWKLSEGSVVLPCNITNEDLRHLQEVQCLVSLRFSDTSELTDTGLAHLAGTNLKRLDISQARRVTDAGVAHLGRIHTLESLNLCNCRNVTSASIQHLKGLPNLRSIRLSGSRIDKNALAAAVPKCRIEP